MTSVIISNLFYLDDALLFSPYLIKLQLKLSEKKTGSLKMYSESSTEKISEAHGGYSLVVLYLRFKQI